ncbi:MAG: hypothetical protein COB59_04675 [Rhodospirillaceae bacterium]|nr:MAG: hypothetical protein COB59_04675 [Rhodospirillaceae bacterium]
MVRFSYIFKHLRMLNLLVLLAVGVIGAVGTLAVGGRIKDSALQSWTKQAELDVAAATIAAQSWLAQSETIMSGLAQGFRDPQKITAEEFDDMVWRAEEWSSEFSLDSVAIVKRILRPERHNMEQVLGQSLSHALDASKSVAYTYDHLVVVNSSNAEGVLRPSIDLLTMAGMGTVARTANQVPGKAVMGPAFSDANGDLYSLVGIGIPNQINNDTVLVGLVNLTEMIGDLMANHVPQGLILRLSERDNDARADTFEYPIYGSLEAGPEALQTVTIRITRGQARWNYNWDITKDYRGGAPTASVTAIQFVGLIITLLIMYSIGAISVQNAIIKGTVEERTAKLTKEVGERKQAQKALLSAKEEAEAANRAKSEFLSSMSHELRTPLNAILGFAQVLQLSTDEPLTQKQESSTRQIVNGGTHLLNLINDVLNLEKIDSGQMDLFLEPVNSQEVLDDCLSILAPSFDKLNLTLNVDDFFDTCLHTDKMRFKQVLLNLLSNAAKYNCEGGTITVGSSLAQNGFCRISITDTGHGIPKAKQEDLFQPFSRLGAENSNIEGTGIGLTITQHLLDVLGGRIGFDSAEGVGSTFWLELPLAMP